MFLILSRRLRFFLLAAFYLGIGSASIQSATAAGAVGMPPSVLETLKKQKLSLSDLGIWVQAVDSNKPLLTHLPDDLFNPASVMKLVTSVVALDVLGTNFQWTTRVYADALPVNGVVHGNLYIKGEGDPWFRSEDLWDLVRQLSDLGIHEVTGKLVLDNSYFDPGPNSSKARALGRRISRVSRFWGLIPTHPL
ncbi:MAG: hypothetical protein B7X28_03350 [Halothiobacillus sp. 13-55-253]|nr:MAG: hypothetical protein B7X28_03350 [Halothiobacillus sp. 13-55-253]